MDIAAEIMHRTGLSERGQEENGVPWVAVHHGDNHIHIVAVLARLDNSRKARLDTDYDKIGKALRDIEASYGLRVLDRPDRTAAVRPTRAETEKAARAGRAEPPRVTLRRHAAAAAAAARSEQEFFTGLEQRGVQVRLRYSTREPGTVTGYAVALPGDLTAGGALFWYGGRRLAPDLSLPAVRRRWPGSGPGQSPGPGGRPPPGRLSGAAMTDGAARAALRREVTRCAAAARSEAEFFTGLTAAGLLTRLRHSPSRPGPAAGYAVSLPGLTHYRDGQQVWYGGQTLDPRLSLAALRGRWRAGRPGAAPGADLFAGQAASDIYRYAALAAADAARQLQPAGSAQAGDVAWAAADLLTAAAEATGSPELRSAADWFARAGRAPWGRPQAPSPGGLMLRTAAYLLAACSPGGWQRQVTRAGLLTALTGLARALARLRTQQQRLLQAAAAREAAAGLAAAGVTERASPLSAPAASPAPAGKRTPARTATVRTAARRRPGPAATRASPGPSH
jgi:hypothetical protein